MTRDDVCKGNLDSTAGMVFSDMTWVMVGTQKV